MTHVTIALLGTPEIRHTGQVVSFPTRKALALLAYLAAEGGLHSREKLTALFWPDSDAERGRSTLRKTVLYLRQGLREDDAHSRNLIIENAALGFNTEGIDLDLAALEKAWTLARTTSASASSASVGNFPATDMAAAIRRYRGDFLEGFTLRDAPDFDSWAAVQREVWHRRLQLVFDRFSQWQLDTGDLPGAVETAARWVACAPLNEMAHRRLMQGYLVSGDRSAAFQAYTTCCAILKRELNAEPTPATEALGERIRQQQMGSLSQEIGDSLPHPTAFEGPLTGRAAEHIALVTAYREVRRGRPQVALIAGEPGIGKTRLAQEFLKWAAAQGADVLQGRTIATIDHASYQVLISALRHRMERENAPEDLLDDVWLAELSRLLPELRERYPDLPASTSGGENEARTRVFEAITRLGQALARRKPLVLFLDDLQWADAASLDALHYAVRCWSEDKMPILFVGCVRADELTTQSVLLDWVNNLGRMLPVIELYLGALSKEDTLHLTQMLVHDDKEQELGQWLARETGGHPLFIVETLKSLAERGVLIEDDRGRWLMADPGSLEDRPEKPIPRGVQDVIRARVSRVSAPGKLLLTAGAVLGHALAFEDLVEVAGLDEEHGLIALEETLTRRLFVAAGDRYQFTHDKVREVIYADTTAARRQIFHRRALEVGERVAASPAELAYHAWEARLEAPAFHWSIAAGAAAMQLFAVDDAIAHFERAWVIWHRTNGVRSGLLGDNTVPVEQFLAPFGRAYELKGNLDQARTIYQEMLTFARETRNPNAESMALNRLATLWAQNWYDFAQAKNLLEQALVVANQNHDAVGRAETEWNLAQTEYYATHYDEAAKHGARALALARDLGSEDLVARCLNVIAYINAMQNDWAQCEIHAEAARNSYTKLGNRAMEADCLALLADTRIEIGRPQNSVDAARAAMAISQEIDNPWGIANVTAILAQGLLEMGQLSEALDQAQRGVKIARTNSLKRMLIQDLLTLGEVYFTLLDVETARSLYAEAFELREGSTRPPFWQMLLGGLCATSAFAEEWDSAYEYARQAIIWRPEGTPLYRGFNRWVQIEALVHGGAIELARADVERLAQDINASPRYRLCYLRARAVLAKADGDADRAIVYLEEAEKLAQELNLPNEVWSVEMTICELYRAQGQPDQAARCQSSAKAIIHTLANEIADPQLRTAFEAKALSGPSKA